MMMRHYFMEYMLKNCPLCDGFVVWFVISFHFLGACIKNTMIIVYVIFFRFLKRLLLMHFRWYNSKEPNIAFFLFSLMFESFDTCIFDNLGYIYSLHCLSDWNFIC